MKFLLLFSFMSVVYATTDPVWDKMRVHKIEDIEYKGEMAHIEISGSVKTYTIPKDHKSMPCLWNGWMAPQEVILGIDEDSGKIVECKLYATGIPHLKNYENVIE